MMQIPIFDGHNDTLTLPFRPEKNGNYHFFQRNETGHLDLPRAREAGLLGALFAIFTPPAPDSPERDPYHGLTIGEGSYKVSPRSAVDAAYARAFTEEVLEYAERLEAEAGGALRIVRSHEALDRNFREGVFSVVLHMEGAAAIEKDGLRNLEAYYERGLRSLGLVWSRPNVFGNGVPFRFPHSPDVGSGLTAAGKALVQRCNELGIAIDLAHINEKGFWDVAELSDAPLIVSHAGVHALCPSTRNLTDRQLDVIGESGGIVGIIFEPSNLRSDGYPETDTPLTEILRHIDYVVERIGVDHVAFGSDFDGADMPQELGDVTGLPRLMHVLQETGYGQEALEKIAYRNWLRVLRGSWER